MIKDRVKLVKTSESKWNARYVSVLCLLALSYVLVFFGTAAILATALHVSFGESITALLWLTFYFTFLTRC